MPDFARKLALVAAAVLVPTGLALGATAIGSDTGAPPVRVEDSTVRMQSPGGQEGRASSSSSTSPSTSSATSSPGPAPEPTPAPAPVQPAQPVEPVVPYYGDDWDEDWDDDSDDGDWDDDWDD